MPIPKKHFGQHFLCDQEVIHRIVRALAPQVDDHLIEIGPGQGALTAPVLEEVQQLEVIELDRDLIPTLKRRTQKLGKLEVYEADVLDFDFSRVKQDDRLLRVFGNLPYNISTPLIFHLLDFSAIIADMLFMLQKEVAERLSAKPDSAHYGRLSVMVQYHYEVSLLFNIPATAFYPPPQVQSSIVYFKPYRTYPYRAKDENLFADIVRHAFGQRRKTIRNSLKDLVNDDVWAHIPIHSDLRAENLSIKDFVDITNAVSAAQTNI